MISPLRRDVLLTGFVLAIPVLLLGMRGDLSVHEVATRLLWCLAAGWAAVTVVRLATTPPAPKKAARRPVTAAAPATEDATPA